MGKLFEADDYITTNIVLLFLLINFNLQIGTIYLFMSLIDWFSYYLALKENPFKLIPLEKEKSKRFINLVWAMGIYVVFIFVVNFLTIRFSLVEPGVTALENIAQLMSSTFSATPILFGSLYLKLVVWGILVAIIETRSFFRTWLQWGLHAAKIKMPSTIFSVSAIGISAFFGAIFSVFHLVAKGITNNSSLFVTFAFGFTSVMMVIHFKEAIQAVLLHIITNTIATMQQLKLGFFAPGSTGLNTAGFAVLGGVILAAWLLLFQELPLVGTTQRLN